MTMANYLAANCAGAEHFVACAKQNASRVYPNWKKDITLYVFPDKSFVFVSYREQYNRPVERILCVLRVLEYRVRTFLNIPINAV